VSWHPTVDLLNHTFGLIAISNHKNWHCVSRNTIHFIDYLNKLTETMCILLVRSHTKF